MNNQLVRTEVNMVNGLQVGSKDQYKITLRGVMEKGI